MKNTACGTLATFWSERLDGGESPKPSDFDAWSRARQKIRRAILRRLIAHHKGREEWDGRVKPQKEDFAEEEKSGPTT
ncbi:MAG TPA: hypothetical protein VL361_22790 [Candidatus Limnocylindrales bacterium]|nr:hypothetical protein [Candidatus Limnocylindrales bacterium]